MSVQTKVSVLYKHWEKYSGEIPDIEGLNIVPLNSEIEDAFWRFAIERMNVFYRKDSGAPYPWSQDEILKKNFFTNMYRELDKTTIWIHEWLNPVKHDLSLLWLNILYARFCGKPETLMETGHLDFDLSKADKNIAIYEARPAGQKVTSAYLFPIAGALSMGCPGRPQFFYQELPRRAKAMAEVLEANKDSSISELILKLIPLVGFGAKFHLTEALMDLGYIRPDIVNEYKPLYCGPGAMPIAKALNKKARVEDVIYTLMKTQPKEFPRLEFKTGKVNLTACAIEQILCEHRKYTSLLNGEGRNRKYIK